jgi:transcriptional regulator with PAS, ATPase and Fis domain
MSDVYRGGNGRMLTRLLDHLTIPLAILDRRGQIVFVNSKFCQMAGQDASLLVGKSCSWNVAADGPLAAILTALAPPAAALDGHIVTRQLTAPIIYGTTETGQLFFPISNDEGVVEATAVVLGKFEQIQQIVPASRGRFTETASPERTLVQIRSRWKALDDLTSLIGSSPKIQLAMQRAQMSVAHPCHTFIYGPPGSGKLECCHGIFLGRLKSAGLPTTKGQFFPIDCRVLDSGLIDGMLEVFTQRLNPELPVVAQQMVLIGVDCLSESDLQRIDGWMDHSQQQCLISCTSNLSAMELAARSAGWSEMASRLSCIEVFIPPLTERPEDILPLALHWMAEECKRSDRAQLTFAPETVQRLTAYPWPKNLRQLRQAMQHSVQQAVLTSAVTPDHLPLAIRSHPSSVQDTVSEKIVPINLDAVLEGFEKTIISRALELSPRNRAQAARLLGISRPRLLRRIEQLGIDQASSAGKAEDQDPATG